MASDLPSGWRYIAQRIAGDGQPGAFLDLDLPLSEVRLTDQLSGPGQLTGKISPVYRRMVAADGDPLLDEWATVVWAECDGAIRGGGIYRTGRFTGPDWEITCVGFTAYPTGMGPDHDATFTDADPLDVVRYIWSSIQAGQNSNLGLQVDAATTTPVRIGTPVDPNVSGSGPFEISPWATSDLGQVIDDLAKSTPFDYREVHAWNGTRDAVTHTLLFGYPLLGQRRTNLRFVVGENIQKMPTGVRDGGSFANHVRFLGSGEGRDMIRAESMMDDGRLRRMVVLDDKSVQTNELASLRAGMELSRREPILSVADVVVRDTALAPLGSFDVGDEIRIQGTLDWIEVDLWMRVVAIDVSPDVPDRIAMTLVRSDIPIGQSGDLISRIKQLEARADAANRSPQLTNSSIDNSSVNVYDSSGQVTTIIGQQFDGTSGAVTVAGPNPPQPTAPTVTSVIGGVKVNWDGDFTDPQAGFTSPVVAPLDWKCVEIYVSQDADFPGTDGTRPKDFIISTLGGQVTIPFTPANTPVWVRLVARTNAGKASVPSAVTGPVNSGAVSAADVGFEPGNTVYFGASGPTPPTDGFMVGDLWLQDTGQTGSDGQPLFLTYRWDGNAWVLLQDQGISTALADAAGAQSTADQAGVDALAAQATADSKVKTFHQTSPPTATSVGDLWADTDDNNRLYRWDGSSWVDVRDGGISQAVSDASTALTTAQSAQAAVDGKVTSFFQTTAPTSGMSDGDLWFDTDDGYHLYRFDGGTSTWVDAADARISSALSDAANAQATADGKIITFYQAGTPTAAAVGDLWVETDNGNKLWRWNGTSWQDARDTTIALAQSTADGKITAFYQSTAPVSGMQAGDLWVDTDDNSLHRYTGSAWVSIQDAAISQALNDAATAQATADGKVKIFAQTTSPTAEGVGDLWIDTDDGNKLYTWTGSVWQARQLGNSSIQPGALVASDVIATGTVTSALLEAILVLATRIVAGDVNGVRAEMKADGFHVYNSSGDEVIRMGTTSDDYFGVVNSAGQLVASVDSSGQGNFSGLFVAEDPVIEGQLLSDLIAQANAGGGNGTRYPGARNWYGWDDTGIASIPGVTSEVGLLELYSYVDSGRLYALVPSLYYTRSDVGTYLQIQVRDGGANSPTLSDTIVMTDFFVSGNPGNTVLAEHHRLWRPSTTGVHRLLMTAASGGGGSINVITSPMVATLAVLDLGPYHGNACTVNRGSGGTTVAQQHFVELTPIGHETWRGNGAALGPNTKRTDTSDVVQGWDPSGANGDGVGYWWFSIPPITGTVDRVQWHVYTNHTYYDTGGRAIWNLIPSGAIVSGGDVTNKQGIGGDQPVSGYPKPGWKDWDLPAAWLPQFKQSPPSGLQAIGLSAGNSDSTTDETMYCRFDGPSARLRIWYTQ